MTGPLENLPDGKRVIICPSTIPPPPAAQPSPFLRTIGLLNGSCFSRTGGAPGPVEGDVVWSFPVLVAAIDPRAEDELTGLRQAVTSGRYLAEGDTVTPVKGTPFAAAPVIASTVSFDGAAPVLPFRTGYDKRAKARDLLAAVGLKGREDDLPAKLSGGQQQRVAIARALIGDPRLLLADEPTGNLDSTTGEEVLDLLFALHRDRGLTLILATHDPAVAVRCDRVVELSDGMVTGDSAAATRAER